MDTQSIAIFIPIVTVISAVVMVIYLRKYANDERMAMIDKGINPGDMKRPADEGFGTLKLALLLIGVGLGFLIGYFIDDNTRMGEMSYFSMLFIFGGLGLGIAYAIQKKRMEDHVSQRSIE